jgi:DNA-binding transcriptional ArsR family regulator
MLRVHFTAADLTRTTISPNPDPLWEILLSGFRLRERHRTVIHRPWMRALGAMSRSHTSKVHAGFGVLDVLAPMGPYFPDFLTPPEGRQGLAAGLESLRNTSRRELCRQLERLGARRVLPAWVRPLAEGDPAALTRLTGTLSSYHEAAVAPFAELIEQSIAADHAQRVHQLVAGGVDGLLAGMRPLMRWQPPVLEVDYGVERELHLDGRGLRFVPSYFCHRVPVSLADPELPPVLVYPIAQQFVWSGVQRRPAALDKLLGSTRNAVLRAIGGGATTTELGRRLTISLASVSRHTAVLRDAGLVRSDRDGAAVLHTLTPLGTALLDTALLDTDRG